ncbi:cytochrome P450 [Astrocystis sublimbata]|nr:cytochrome P450 [Astrocystis sublimbata]
MRAQVLQAAQQHLPNSIELVVAASLGVLVHRVHFIRGEHHRNAHLYLSLWLIISIVRFAVHYFSNIEISHWRSYAESSYYLLLLNGSFLGAMCCSIIVYRLFEHPLRHFSGPRLAAISKLWHFSHILNKSNHLFVDSIYRKYGTIVRTGPQELTIVDPAIWQHISGPGTSCIKSPWYDQLWPIVSISSIRTKEGYARRRKRWDEALNSVTKKEIRVHHYVSLFLQHIRASGEKPINITTWFQNLAFDMMGELAFEESFSFTQQLASVSRQHEITTLIEQGFSMLRIFTPIPWITGILGRSARTLPFVTQKWNNTLDWAARICDTKIKESAKVQGGPSLFGQEKSGIFSHFIDSAILDSDWGSLDRLNLQGDALVITVAGSDTTSEVLTMLFFELARRVDIQNHLRKEVASAGLTPGLIDIQHTGEILRGLSTRKLPFLDACINEIMRLYPPLPTAGIRQTVDKGFQFGEYWIPPNTIIVAPRWSIGRLDSAFVQPNDFVPERWTTRPSMVKKPEALNAFGAGRHLCPGKQLGMMQVRIVTALIIANFKFGLSPAEASDTRVLKDFTDAFTSKPGKLELVFTPIIRG